MNCLFVLTLVVPFTLAVNVDFYQNYGTAIKSVDIPSCDAEACALVKGTPLNISVTVETIYPPEDTPEIYSSVSDLESWIFIYGYRNKYVYSLAEKDLFCKLQANECPLKLMNRYTINRQLFLSKDDEQTEHTGFGSKNGPVNVVIKIVMKAQDGFGAIIANGGIILDIKPAQT